jgi:hypothetical protein
VITRDDFKNQLTSFEWKTVEPCNRALEDLAQILQTQPESIKSVSIVGRRLTQDRARQFQSFHCGTLSIRTFTSLEYLDIDSRYLVRSLDLENTDLSLGAWLNILACLRILGIDAVTEIETPYVQQYLEELLEGREMGLYTQLKKVRVGFMSVKGGRLVPWKVLERLPVQYLINGVRLVGWEYDVGEDIGRYRLESEDSRAFGKVTCFDVLHEATVWMFSLFLRKAVQS